MTPEDYGKWTTRYDAEGIHYIPGHKKITKERQAWEIHTVHGKIKLSLFDRIYRKFCNFYINKG